MFDTIKYPNYPYRAALYYGVGAKSPKVKGELAIEVVNKTKHGLQIDIDVGIKRPDIGYIYWIGPDWSGQWREENVSNDSGTVEDSSMPMSKGPN